MKRVLSQLIVAVLFFGVGWLVGRPGTFDDTWIGRLGRPSGVFRLNIEAPVGETTIKCEGCQFLKWENGRSHEEPVFTLTCKNKPCGWTVGAITKRPEPKLMAGEEQP